MKTIRTQSRLCWPAAALAALWLATCAWGDLAPPLYVGNLQPVLDQFGRPMPGSPLVTQAARRPLVELRTATTGVFPPLTNGTAHPLNPLLSVEGSTGGVGLNTATANAGLFCVVLPDRPAGAKVFARVYNAPTVAEATFYADSYLVDIPAAPANSLVLTFKAAAPIQSGDADGDGLADSWEELLGTDDRATADYDKDGMSDLDEMLSGTALDDPDSKLSFRTIRRESATVPLGDGTVWTNPVVVRWQSVPGKKYRLEYVPMLAVDDPETGEPYAFTADLDEDGVEDDVIVAGENEYEIGMIVDVPDPNLTGVFRVKLVP